MGYRPWVIKESDTTLRLNNNKTRRQPMSSALASRRGEGNTGEDCAVERGCLKQSLVVLKEGGIIVKEKALLSTLPTSRS